MAEMTHHAKIHGRVVLWSLRESPPVLEVPNLNDSYWPILVFIIFQPIEFKWAGLDRLYATLTEMILYSMLVLQYNFTSRKILDICLSNMPGSAPYACDMGQGCSLSPDAGGGFLRRRCTGSRDPKR